MGKAPAASHFFIEMEWNRLEFWATEVAIGHWFSMMETNHKHHRTQWGYSYMSCACLNYIWFELGSNNFIWQYITCNVEMVPGCHGFCSNNCFTRTTCPLISVYSFHFKKGSVDQVLLFQMCLHSVIHSLEIIGLNELFEVNLMFWYRVNSSVDWLNSALLVQSDSRIWDLCWLQGACQGYINRSCSFMI